MTTTTLARCSSPVVCRFQVEVLTRGAVGASEATLVEVARMSKPAVSSRNFREEGAVRIRVNRKGDGGERGMWEGSSPPCELVPIQNKDSGDATAVLVFLFPHEHVCGLTHEHALFCLT